MTSRTARSRRRPALRGFTFFLLGGGLGVLACQAATPHPSAAPWVGLVLGALVCGVLTGVFPGRRRD